MRSLIEERTTWVNTLALLQAWYSSTYRKCSCNSQSARANSTWNQTGWVLKKTAKIRWITTPKPNTNDSDCLRLSTVRQHNLNNISLLFSKNKIGKYESIASIAKSLQNLTQLKSLNLRWYVAKGLLHCDFLHSLEVQHNSVLGDMACFRSWATWKRLAIWTLARKFIWSTPFEMLVLVPGQRSRNSQHRRLRARASILQLQSNRRIGSS